ncbi:MAG: hypothetical protein AAFX50_03640, partial [Acidobacteriota bacterium]
RARPRGRRTSAMRAATHAGARAAYVAAPAAADVLVMKDGSRVETKGPWEVKGRQVIFTLPNGTLSAVRLSEVDLDRSNEATEIQRRPPAPQPTAREEAAVREPVLVLTNDDIAAGTPGAEDGDDDAAPAAGSTGEGVVVSEWSYEPGSGDSVHTLTGSLENQTGGVIENLQVYVDIIAVDAGTPRPEAHILRQARVAEERLEAGDTTDFSYDVSIRDLEYALAPAEQFETPRVTFDIQFRRANVRGAAAGDDLADSEDGELPADAADGPAAGAGDAELGAAGEEGGG